MLLNSSRDIDFKNRKLNNKLFLNISTFVARKAQTLITLKRVYWIMFLHSATDLAPIGKESRCLGAPQYDISGRIFNEAAASPSPPISSTRKSRRTDGCQSIKKFYCLVLCPIIAAATHRGCMPLNPG